MTSESVARQRGAQRRDHPETIAIHKLDFERVKRANPNVADVLLTALVAQIRRLSGQLVEALYVPVDRRVLRRPQDLTVAYRSGEDEVVIPLTQEDIASLAGTSRATVNRVLREQQRRGVVALRRGRTVVLDADALVASSR